MGITMAQAMYSFMSNSTEMCYFAVDLTDGSFDITPCKFSEKLLAADKNPLSQLAVSKKIHPADLPLVSAFCGDLLSGGDQPCLDEHYNIDFRIDMSENGEPDWHWATMTVLIGKSEDGRHVSRTVCHIRLMNSSELLTKTIVDSFTNDKHPAVFASNVQKLLNDTSGRQLAFMQFDIEKFKLINAKYGENKGTEILNFITNGLYTVCTDEQVHLRLSADVFMIAFLFETAADINRLIGLIEERLGHYEDIEYRFVFGVHIVSDKTLPLRKMGDRAAIARQSIKGNALNNVGYYSDNQENKLISRKYIEDRMYYALEHGEFVMFLQPKCSISTGEIIGAEALARWIHPEKGMISPMEFIPVFEQDGFIIKLDEYIWEQACRTVRGWIDRGIAPVPISVNISRIHLASEEFISTLDRLVEKYDIPKKYIETEITETTENAGTEEMIKKLKSHGYMLLMDDFGSGYSSLNMLKSTPFDVIKIDRDFFSEFMLSDRGKKIISHTISMSKDIGLDLVAEGVETKEQAEFLHSCGCDVAQGFLYSKPVPLSDFDKMHTK